MSIPCSALISFLQRSNIFSPPTTSNIQAQPMMIRLIKNKKREYSKEKKKPKTTRNNYHG